MSSLPNRFDRRLLLTSAIALALSPALSSALPTGGSVAQGTATITTTSGPGYSQVTVNQTSSKAVINWTGFDTANTETVQFNDPNSSSITLNRVNSGAATNFNGTLNSNGSVWIINPNGILIGSSGTINTSGFLATTSNITGANFMAGNYNFVPGGGPASATVSNAGTITIANAGLAALVAPNVTNSTGSTITAHAGNITLASGDTFTVDLAGDGLINLAASPAMTQQSITTIGSALDATGGSINITAAQASAVLDNLINLNPGILNANTLTVSNQSGDLEYNANFNFGSNVVGGGNVTLSAYRNITIDSSARIAPLSGPFNITLDANDTGAAGGGSIYMQNQALINSGGGNIVLGGGANPAAGFAVGNNAPGNDGSGLPVYSNGVTLEGGATLDAEGGNITINGEGLTLASGNTGYSRGVYADVAQGEVLQPTIETTGSGNIYITGKGGAAPSGTSVGVDLEQANVFTDQALLYIKGTGGSAPVTTGVNLYDANVVANLAAGDTTGSIYITGTGGNYAGGNSTGINNSIGEIAALLISTGTGKVTLLGTGGNAAFSTGILSDYAFVTGGQGTIVEGLAGNATTSGTGILVEGAGLTDISVGSMIGGGVPGASNYSGVVFTGAGTVQGYGLNITGTGGTTAGNTGIEIDNGMLFAEDGGTMTLTGSTGASSSTASAIQGNIAGGANNEFLSIMPGGIATLPNLTFVADTLNLNDTVFTNYNGPFENISFVPYTPSTSIGVGGASGTLQIPGTLINAIGESTLKVTVGSTSDTGAMTVGTQYWNSSVNFLNGSGNTTLTGVTTSADNITIADTSGDFINTAGGGALAPGTNSRFLIYTEGPSNNTLDGIGKTANFVQYGCAYNPSGQLCSGTPTTGNGLIYSEQQ